MQEYWLRQNPKEPLFEDILWSRPETKKQKKKLVLVGGNTHSFMDVAKSYELVNVAGIGDTKVVLPKKLENLIGNSLPSAVYLENNPSGGITKQGLSAMLEYEKWGDGVLLAGDFGHSSETSSFVHSYIESSKKPLIISGDTLDFFSEDPSLVFEREDTLIVADFKQLQKMLPKLGLGVPLTNSMGLVKLVDVLNELTEDREATVVTFFENSVLVAMYGEVVSTHFTSESDWLLGITARASVFFLQHQEKPFQAVASSILD